MVVCESGHRGHRDVPPSKYFTNVFTESEHCCCPFGQTRILNVLIKSFVAIYLVLHFFCYWLAKPSSGSPLVLDGFPAFLRSLTYIFPRHFNRKLNKYVHIQGSLNIVFFLKIS